MEKENFSENINNTDKKYTDETAIYAAEIAHNETGHQTAHDSTSKRKTFLSRRRAVAVCLALLTVLGFTAAVITEAKEYDTASAFFESNGLPTDGLSRSDIKTAYRNMYARKTVYCNMYTRSFTYEKNADVIMKNVPGCEIRQREPTSEELSMMWDKNTWMSSPLQNGISYQKDYRYTENASSGLDILDKSILECYLNGSLLWTAEITDFFITDSSYTSEGTAVWGTSEAFSSTQRRYGWLARIDDAGTVLWQKCLLNHGFDNEYIAAVLSDSNGTWTVISRGDLRYLCLGRYDADGQELSFQKTEVGNSGIWNAAHLGDGYIVQLGDLSSGDTAHLVKLDREGNILNSFTYEADDCEYYLTDMVEFAGQVCLSAYAVPKRNDEGSRHESANIFDYVFSREGLGWNISSKELTPVVRNNYTAVLLMCDSEDGTPKTFRSVKGSLGDKLSVNDAGQLEWDVHSIASTFYSPATSSFTIGGTCSIFRYTFDTKGVLAQQTDTGETVPYRR